MQNSMGSNIETLYKLVDNRVEALEFKVKRNARTESLLGIPLMELSLIPNLIVCGIIRDGNIITPSGRDTIEDGDNVIIVTTNLGLNDLSDIIKG
jgi:trk system potassium uptake protein TrkA